MDLYPVLNVLIDNSSTLLYYQIISWTVFPSELSVYDNDKNPFYVIFIIKLLAKAISQGLHSAFSGRCGVMVIFDMRK